MESRGREVMSVRKGGRKKKRKLTETDLDTSLNLVLSLDEVIEKLVGVNDSLAVVGHC